MGVSARSRPFANSENASPVPQFTDESRLYSGADLHFADHQTVKHSVGEYVRAEVHTNTIEGAFSIFKRGMKGIYQHCDEKHLHRYLAEFDFRYNHRVGLGYSDIDRTKAAIVAPDSARYQRHRRQAAHLIIKLTEPEFRYFVGRVVRRWRKGKIVPSREDT